MIFLYVNLDKSVMYISNFFARTQYYHRLYEISLKLISISLNYDVLNSKTQIISVLKIKIK